MTFDFLLSGVDTGRDESETLFYRRLLRKAVPNSSLLGDVLYTESLILNPVKLSPPIRALRSTLLKSWD